MAMAPLWIPVWRVDPNGETVVEYRASVSRYAVTVRRLGQTKGGTRYRPAWFETYFGASRLGAIDRFIAHQTTAHGDARTKMELAHMLITRGVKLRDKENG
jgi:hypothetical protein